MPRRCQLCFQHKRIWWTDCGPACSLIHNSWSKTSTKLFLEEEGEASPPPKCPKEMVPFASVLVNCRLINDTAEHGHRDHGRTQRIVDFFPAVRVQNIAMSMSVCLSVCLTIRITRKSHGRTIRRFLCMLPVWVARSSCNGDAIRFLLPVIWITSYFTPWGANGQNQARPYV